MANTLTITFNAPAQVEDRLSFKLSFFIQGTVHQQDKDVIFKTVRVYPGEVSIGSDANYQALTYFNAFNMDYNTLNQYTVVINQNIVTITPNSDNFLSEFSTTGSSFATGVITSGDSSWFSSPYLDSTKAFTLDQKYFELSTNDTDTYFQFNTYVKTYDFFTNAIKQREITQKAVAFQGKAKLNIGKIIHRLMGVFETVNHSYEQYKAAEANISCFEMKFDDNSVIRSYTTKSIYFIAGLSKGLLNHGFLEFNQKRNRVTQKSFAYLNMITSAESYELRTFKNGDLINTENIINQNGTILCKKVLFDTYKPGDLIDYCLDIVGQNNSDAPKKSFCIFPNSLYSNMIVWENEFKLQSTLECTGTASIEGELEFQSQKGYADYVETVEHLSSTKELKLSINTGWLLRTDIDTVESLVRSKRAWLIQGDKVIKLRSMNKKTPKDDYESELISFQLEFTINRNYDEETYTL